MHTEQDMPSADGQAGLQLLWPDHKQAGICTDTPHKLGHAPTPPGAGCGVSEVRAQLSGEHVWGPYQVVPLWSVCRLQCGEGGKDSRGLLSWLLVILLVPSFIRRVRTHCLHCIHCDPVVRRKRRVMVGGRGDGGRWEGGVMVGGGREG